MPQYISIRAIRVRNYFAGKNVQYCRPLAPRADSSAADADATATQKTLWTMHAALHVQQGATTRGFAGIRYSAKIGST